MRIGVVGTGGIANQYHLPALLRLSRERPDVVLAGVCDLDIDRARAAADHYGFENAYTDYRRLLSDAGIDAVWVLVSVAATRSVAGFFLARGIPTFMEKPPGTNLDEAYELAEIAETHQTPHMVAFNRRFTPFILRMHDELIRAGGAEAVSCQFYRTHRTELAFPFCTGLHGLDALLFLSGRRVEFVETMSLARGGRLVTLGFVGGVTGLMEMLPQVGVQSERYVGHVGDRTFVADGLTNWQTHYPGFYESYQHGKLVERIENQDSEPPECICGFYGESVSFVDALLLHQLPGPTVSDALQSIQIAAAVQNGESRRFS